MIPILCGPAYAVSAQLMWIFVIYQLFYSAFYVLGIYPLLVEKPQLSLFAVAAGLLVNVGLNALWIPRYGVTGGAMAAVASMVAVVLTLALLTTRHGFRLQARSVLVLLLLAMPALRWRPALLLGYLAVAAVAVWTTWILTAEEKALLREKLAGLRRRPRDAEG